MKSKLHQTLKEHEVSNFPSAVELLRHSLDMFFAKDMKGWSLLCADDIVAEFPFALRAHQVAWKAVTRYSNAWPATSALTDASVTSRREWKKVEMLFAHLTRILRLDRLRLRGLDGARDEFLLAATAQNLRKLAKLIPDAGPSSPERHTGQTHPTRTQNPVPLKVRLNRQNAWKADVPSDIVGL